MTGGLRFAKKAPACYSERNMPAVDDEPDRFWLGVASEMGVPLEALQFVYDALQFAPQYAGEEPDDIDARMRHCSAAEFCEGFLLFAKDTFGRSDYVAILKAWSMSTSEEVGRIVYELVERGLLERQEGDKPSDFDGRFNLDQAANSP